MQRTVDHDGQGTRPGPSESPEGTRRLSSTLLLGGQNRVEIEHNGEVYRLQITRQGKLILTK